MDDVDDALRLFAILIIISALSSVVFAALLHDVVPSMPILDESLNVSLEGLAVLSSAPILFVVGTELVLISGGWVTFHWLQAFEEGL